MLITNAGRMTAPFTIIIHIVISLISVYNICMLNVGKKIKDLGFDEYAIITKNNSKYILVFMGYKYYEEQDSDNFPVSPYYFSSNKAYFASKELVEYIKTLGYEASVENKIIYDELLEKCGAIRGKNNLFFIEKLGSLFCVHVIKTNELLQERTLQGIECTNCNRCIKACPTKALSQNGIDKEKCLRDRMDNPQDTEIMDKMCTLLGCDICQKVCPNNDRKSGQSTYPQFNKYKILRGNMDGLADLVGKNMARKRRLQFQAMGLIGKKGEIKYMDDVRYVNDEMLEAAKIQCLGNLKNIDLQ